jgi:hypothetical protein
MTWPVPFRGERLPQNQFDKRIIQVAPDSSAMLVALTGFCCALDGAAYTSNTAKLTQSATKHLAYFTIV